LPASMAPSALFKYIMVLHSQINPFRHCSSFSPWKSFSGQYIKWNLYCKMGFITALIFEK